MSLKKKIFNFLTAMVTIFGSAPALATNAYAAIDPSMKPNYGKYVEDNGDGTYDITLHITGKAKTDTQVTKANVVVIMDTSGSMDDRTQSYTYNSATYGRYGIIDGEYVQLYYRYRSLFGYDYSQVGNNDNHSTVYTRSGNSYTAYTGTRYSRTTTTSTRLAVAKSATKSLAQQLLSYNDSTNPDIVQMALIDFATNVKSSTTHTSPTTSLNTFNGWINNLSANGGTNWETALTAANAIDFGDSDPTYIVFVSDGEPTFRDSANGYTNDKNGNVYGNGQNDPNSRNLNAAKTVAASIISSGKTLFTVGAFGNAGNMQALGGTYAKADDQDALETAFADIVSKITNNLSLSEITFEDGITNLADIAVSGNVAHFTYRKGKNWDGDEATLKNLPNWNPTADGAGTASFANQKVTWNLGDNYVLSDNETAAVTFTVYPDQEAYDLLAELNNGVISYADLTAAQKQSVVQSGNAYTFQTNTANPTVHYCVLTNSSTGAQSKECTTDTIANSNPQPISATIVNVRKIWDAGLDQKQFTDIENTEITFDLLVNGSDINKTKLEKTNLKLNKTNNWKVANIAIAPGSMVSSGHEAYDEASAIDGYTVLATGHQYYFNEHDIDKHFTLVDYKYHPMYVNGELKNVVFTYDNNGQITGIKKIKSLTTQNNQLELTATNRLKGGVEITKQIKVNGQVTTAKSTDTFPITIYVKHADGRTDYSSELAADGTCYLTCVSIYDVNTGERLSKQPFSNGKIETTIRSDQKIIISDLEAGAYYSVEETTTNLPVGYDRSESGKISYDITRYTTYEDGETPTFTGKQLSDGRTYYPVENNASSKAIVKNYFYTGSLKLTKTVEKHGLNPATTDFDFTIKIAGQADQTITLKDGESKTITDLPVGATYTVTEKDYSNVGFTTTSTGATGTIARDVNGKPAQTATFTNSYSVSPVKTTLTVRKSGFDDFWDLSHLQNQEFQFCIESKNLCQTANRLTKSTTFTFTYAEPATETLTVTENTTNFAPGIVRKSGDSDIVANITVTDNGYGQLIATIERTKGNLTYRTEEIAEIFNDYQLAPTDEVTVTLGKTIVDLSNNAPDTTFQFAFTDDQGAVQNLRLTTRDLLGSTTLINRSFDTAGTYIYTIQEINDGQKYFNYDTALHTIIITVSDGLQGQLVATTTIDGQELSTLTITNLYNNEPGQGGTDLPKTPNTGRATAPTAIATDTSFLTSLATSITASTLLLSALFLARRRQPLNR